MTSKFKVGDKVQVVKDHNCLNAGDVHTVVRMWSYDREVPYDQPAVDHPKYPDGCGMNSDFFVLYNPTLRPGDKVVQIEAPNRCPDPDMYYVLGTGPKVLTVKSVSGDFFTCLEDEHNRLGTRYKLVGDTNTYEPTAPAAVTKDTNPKDACGIKKPPMSTVSGPVLQEVGVAMLEGAMKYGRHNYRDAGVRSSVYYDAALRHLIAYWEGEDVDRESGLSHLTKAIAGLAVLRDSEINGNFIDDRPPRVDLQEHKVYLQSVVDSLFDKYPTPKEAYTHAE